MLDAVKDLDFKVLIPVGIGGAFGLLLFARFLEWIFRRFHDAAVALMTGFVAGSLLIIWPWKRAQYLLDAAGIPVLKKGKEIVEGYEWFWPSAGHASTWWALGYMAIGFIIVWWVEVAGEKKSPA
jgi:putative membrane protein